MALPMLVGGSECGPINPLQGLSKRFDQDRGLQQDYFGAGRAGSSKEAFRSQHAASSAPDQDAARFFSSNRPSAPNFGPDGSFDMGNMRSALPMSQVPVRPSPQVQQSPLANWASDFVQQQPMQRSAPREVHQDQAFQHTGAAPISSQPIAQWTPARQNFRMNSMPSFMPQIPKSQIQPAVTSNQISWDKEFSALDEILESPAVQLGEQKQEVYEHNTAEADELARTAGLLLENVKNEQNPKFQNSQFIGLMRQLRDGQVIVEGNQMVESEGRSSSAVDVKGKGRAIEITNTSSMRQPIVRNADLAPQHTNFSEDAARALAAMANETQKDTQFGPESEIDAYFREDNADYMRYWNENPAPVHYGVATAETAAWDTLQQDWDQFEATSTGIKPVVNYQFQQNNPYLLGDSSQTRTHAMHANTRQSVFESVLELEAAVQRDPSNAGAWYELGVKQQENEREHKALQALQRAVELDSSHLPAWLALAISYTNDNNRHGTYYAIREWVDRNDKYSEAVQMFRANVVEGANPTILERYNHLIRCLIVMAQSSPPEEVDADIQIALAVLLNTNEDYVKAQDCFRTALDVRPDDWLLYNRVGATMANSGRAEEALEYYYRALELNPAYIRARFNLGISCINLRRYDEAAGHILDALVLQDSDGVSDGLGLNEKRGVTSTALWESLRTTCLHMQRADLASLCDRKDLQGFRNVFHG